MFRKLVTNHNYTLGEIKIGLNLNTSYFKDHIFLFKFANETYVNALFIRFVSETI